MTVVERWIAERAIDPVDADAIETAVAALE